MPAMIYHHDKTLLRLECPESRRSIKKRTHRHNRYAAKWDLIREMLTTDDVPHEAVVEEMTYETAPYVVEVCRADNPHKGDVELIRHNAFVYELDL